MSTKRTIQFQVKDIDLDIHELLCLAIHEGNIDALDKLTRSIIDINEPCNTK